MIEMLHEAPAAVHVPPAQQAAPAPPQVSQVPPLLVAFATQEVPATVHRGHSSEPGRLWRRRQRFLQLLPTRAEVDGDAVVSLRLEFAVLVQ